MDKIYDFYTEITNNNGLCLMKVILSDNNKNIFPRMFQMNEYKNSIASGTTMKVGKINDIKNGIAFSINNPIIENFSSIIKAKIIFYTKNNIDTFSKFSVKELVDYVDEFEYGKGDYKVDVFPDHIEIDMLDDIISERIQNRIYALVPLEDNMYTQFYTCYAVDTKYNPVLKIEYYNSEYKENIPIFLNRNLYKVKLRNGAINIKEELFEGVYLINDSTKQLNRKTFLENCRLNIQESIVKVNKQYKYIDSLNNVYTFEKISRFKSVCSETGWTMIFYGRLYRIIKKNIKLIFNMNGFLIERHIGKNIEKFNYSIINTSKLLNMVVNKRTINIMYREKNIKFFENKKVICEIDYQNDNTLKINKDKKIEYVFNENLVKRIVVNSTYDNKKKEVNIFYENGRVSKIKENNKIISFVYKPFKTIVYDGNEATEYTFGEDGSYKGKMQIKSDT